MSFTRSATGAATWTKRVPNGLDTMKPCSAALARRVAKAAIDLVCGIPRLSNEATATKKATSNRRTDGVKPPPQHQKPLATIAMPDAPASKNDVRRRGA